MKTNVIRIMCTLTCIFMCMAISAQGDAKKLIGNWSFSAPQAPYGYQDGDCHFKEKNGKLTAIAKVRGSELAINEIIKDSNAETYKCNFYLDGAYIELIFKMTKDDQLEGTVNTQGMNIPVRFNKKVSKVQIKE
ncbi:hypothetical protein [Parabacteroides chinchillae]